MLYLDVVFLPPSCFVSRRPNTETLKQLIYYWKIRLYKLITIKDMNITANLSYRTSASFKKLCIILCRYYVILGLGFQLEAFSKLVIIVTEILEGG